MTKAKTAAIYARFSTDMQKESSIDDQWALCQRVALKQGYKVVKKFADRAKSGASMFDRAELRDLLNAVKNREFDAIIVEDLDRLSRDTEDLAHICKRIERSGLKLINQMGEVSELEAGLKGVISRSFLSDLKRKIKRGLDARAEKGLFPGAVTYGYDRVKDQPGVRIKNPQQAKIVRRIFSEYADGVSVRDIALGLTKDGIPSPSGANRWNHQTFIGANYGRGMLGNRLYIGELIWNSYRSVQNPDTGKTTKRKTDDGTQIIRQVPNLRIIEPALWDRVQELRDRRARTKFGPTGKPRRNVIDRSEHILSGHLFCAACGGPMRIFQRDRTGTPRAACISARVHQACDHSKSYDMNEIKEIAAKELRGDLTSAKNVELSIKEACRHFETIAKQNNLAKAQIARDLANVETEINRLARAIVDGAGSSPTLSKLLAEREAKKAGLEVRLEQASSTNLGLHPNLVPKVIEQMRNLGALMARGDAGEVRAKFLSCVDRVMVHPTGKRMPYTIEVFGRLEAMLGIEPVMRSNAVILAEEGLSAVAPTASGDLPSCRKSHKNIVSFGIWRGDGRAA